MILSTSYSLYIACNISDSYDRTYRRYKYRYTVTIFVNMPRSIDRIGGAYLTSNMNLICAYERRIEGSSNARTRIIPILNNQRIFLYSDGCYIRISSQLDNKVKCGHNIDCIKLHNIQISLRMQKMMHSIYNKIEC